MLAQPARPSSPRPDTGGRNASRQETVYKRPERQQARGPGQAAGTPAGKRPGTSGRNASRREARVQAAGTPAGKRPGEGDRSALVRAPLGSAFTMIKTTRISGATPSRALPQLPHALDGHACPSGPVPPPWCSPHQPNHLSAVRHNSPTTHHYLTGNKHGSGGCDSDLVIARSLSQPPDLEHPGTGNLN